MNRIFIATFCLLSSVFCLPACAAGISWMNRCEPRNLGTLQGWWKADSITNANNTALTNWVDSTGGTHAAVQTSAALEPKFFTGIFGSSGGVRFASDNALGTQQFLDTSSGSSANSITTTGDFTLFCVHVSNANGGSSQQPVIAGNAYVSGTSFLTVSQLLGDTFGAIDEGPSNNDTSANVLTTTNKPIAGVWSKNAGTMNFYANKVNATSGAQAYGTFKFNFIAAANKPSVNRFNGDMAEMAIIFNGISNSQVLALYGSYWRPKYSNLP